MTPTPRRRGAPLAALGVILGGWIAVRVAITGAGFLPQGLADPADVLGVQADAAVSRGAYVPSPPRSPSRSAAVLPATSSSWAPRRPSPLLMAMSEHAAGPVEDRRAVHALAMAAPGAASFVASPAAAVLPPLAPSIRPNEPHDARWSADGWVLLRRDGARGGGSLLSTYGASQAGAVLRYRLAPGSGHRPVAYLRGAAALDGSRQKEAAAGLSARPLPAVPVVAAAELRVTADRFGTRTRPAVLAYTELPPFDLASGLRGEAYLQGGYVGGKGATAFVDGQVRVDRKLADLGRGELRLGGGVWGGAQEGASRLDAGPAAQVAFPLSQDVFARVAFDWRFRIAGDAAPGSGPALTLSAGF